MDESSNRWPGPDHPQTDRLRPEPLAPGGPSSIDWSSWVSARLFDRRVVFLRGELDDRMAGQVVAQLMTLDATGDDVVDLHVDSAEGTLEAAFSVMDTIDLLGVPVHATCVGRAEGPAVGVVAVAERRRAAPHARFRLCEPRSSFEGRAADLERWARHRQAQLAGFVARLAEATGRPGEHLEADLCSGRYLDATEAVSYRLVDEVWQPSRSGRSRDAMRGPLGFRPPPGS